MFRVCSVNWFFNKGLYQDTIANNKIIFPSEIAYLRERYKNISKNENKDRTDLYRKGLYSMDVWKDRIASALGLPL